MSIAAYKEFRREYKKDPYTIYNICSKSGTIEEMTEDEAIFLHNALGELINENNTTEK